jgi:hypothetical protein
MSGKMRTWGCASQTTVLIIRLRHLFINVCNLLVVWLVGFQVSQPYNNTDFTFVLNIRSFNSFWCVVFSPYRVKLNKYSICFRNSTRSAITCTQIYLPRSGMLWLLVVTGDWFTTQRKGFVFWNSGSHLVTCGTEPMARVLASSLIHY